MIKKIKSMHATWNLTTGQDVNYRATERIFWELVNMDFTPEDLLAVLKHVMSHNRKHPYMPMKVQVLKLCGDVEQFASICAEAKAYQRNRLTKPTPKEAVLQSFRRTTPEQPGNAVPVRDVIKGLREAAL